MGAFKKRALAVLIAVVVVMTSGVGVFAATGSSTSGSTTGTTPAEVSGKTIVVTASSATIKYKRIGAKKWKTVTVDSASKEATIKKLVSGGRYIVKADGKTYYRFIRKGKTAKVSASSSKVTVKYKKAKNATKYVVKVYDSKGNVVAKKTVKKLKATFSGLTAGTYKFTVTPKKGKYVGQESAATAFTVS